MGDEEKNPPPEHADSKRDGRASDGTFATKNNIGPRWQPGQSGNPLGRQRSVTDALRRQAAEVADDGRTRAEILATQLWDMALAGNLQAIRELLDRCEGRAHQHQSVEVTSYHPSELGRCEGMVSDLMSEATAIGRPITRAQAIETLSKFDSHVREVLGNGDE
jgi:hypothetical protein